MVTVVKLISEYLDLIITIEQVPSGYRDILAQEQETKGEDD